MADRRDTCFFFAASLIHMSVRSVSKGKIGLRSNEDTLHFHSRPFQKDKDTLFPPAWTEHACVKKSGDWLSSGEKEGTFIQRVLISSCFKKVLKKKKKKSYFTIPHASDQQWGRQKCGNVALVTLLLLVVTQMCLWVVNFELLLMLWMSPCLHDTSPVFERAWVERGITPREL